MKRISIVTFCIAAIFIIAFNKTITFANSESPNDNLFYYTNKDDANRLHGFYMLDVTDSSDSKFFILAKEAYLCMPYDLDRDMRFDPTKPNTIAYAINNGALESAVRDPWKDYYTVNGVNIYVGTWQKFPNVVSHYADPNHVWTTEKTVWSTCSGAILEPYTTTAKFALMSITEFNQYYNNGLGFDAECCIGNTYPWIFRSSMGQNDSSQAVRYMYGVKRGVAGAYQYVNNRSDTYVRPVFYLNEDFFKNVHIDVATMGKNVKKKIVQTYYKEDLEHLYSESELKEIGFPDKYVINTQLFNKNTMEPTETLNGGESLLIKVNIDNNTFNKLDKLVTVTALYDDEGTMLDAKWNNITEGIPGKSSTPAFELTMDIPQNITEGYSLISYAWSGFGDMLPIAKKKVIGSNIVIEPSDTDEAIDVVYDMQERILTVSGKANNNCGGTANVLVISPKKSIQDLNEANFTEVFQYIGQTSIDNEGRYKFIYKVKENDLAGVYSVKLSIDGDIYTDSFVFRNQETDSFITNGVNNAKTSEEVKLIIENNIDLLSISMPLYNQLLNTGDLLDVCENMLNKNIENLDRLIELFNRELAAQVLSVLDEGDEVAEFINEYNNYLGLDLERYMGSLEGNYVNEVYEYLGSISFDNFAELNEMYVKSVILTKINNPVNYNEIKPLITREADVLRGYGVDVNSYLELGDNTGKFDKLLLKELYNTWEQFVNAFNNGINSVENNEEGNKKTSHGGGNSPAVSVIAMPYAEENDSNKTEDLFDDLDTVPWAKDCIISFAQNGFVSGKETGKFFPDDLIKREEFVKILVCVFNYYDNTASAADFNDVEKGSWYYSYIASALKNNIIQGKGDGTIGVGEFVTREDVATMLYRIFVKVSVKEIPKSNFRFNDESELSGYSKEGVYSMQALGVLQGKGDNKFFPKDYCTRAEAVKMIYNIFLLTK